MKNETELTILSAKLGMKEHRIDLLDNMNIMVQAWEMGKGIDGWVWKDNLYDGYTSITGFSMTSMYNNFNKIKDLWMKEKRGLKMYYKPIDNWEAYFNENIIEEGMGRQSTLDIMYRDLKLLETIRDLVDEHNHNMTLMNKLYADEIYVGMFDDLIKLIKSIDIRSE